MKEFRLPREAHDATGDACLSDNWVLALTDAKDHRCTRRQGHEGRHAFIGKLTGRVYSVWGDDVHLETRDRARLEVCS